MCNRLSPMASARDKYFRSVTSRMSSPDLLELMSFSSVGCVLPSPRLRTRTSPLRSSVTAPQSPSAVGSRERFSAKKLASPGCKSTEVCVLATLGTISSTRGKRPSVSIGIQNVHGPVRTARCFSLRPSRTGVLSASWLAPNTDVGRASKSSSNPNVKPCCTSS